jgi:hypothetical protein
MSPFEAPAAALPLALFLSSGGDIARPPRSFHGGGGFVGAINNAISPRRFHRCGCCGCLIGHINDWIWAATVALDNAALHPFVDFRCDPYGSTPDANRFRKITGIYGLIKKRFAAAGFC